MVISVISVDVSLLRFGASNGSRKFASSNVTTITPPAMKISSLRIGKFAPAASVYGMVNINDSVMVPFGPPNVMTAADRQRFAVILRRLPVVVSRANRSISEIHRKRMAITTAETVRIAIKSSQLLTRGSSQLAVIAVGNSMPSRMNTVPFSENDSTPHTLDETMFVRATFGPMPVRSKRMIRPAATTERMPETCTASAPKYRMNGRNSSIRIRVVIVSQPRERIVSNTTSATMPTTMPKNAPPKKDATNCMADSPTSNTPLTAAAMANWKPTMPDASLNSDSPFSTLVCRCVSAASLPSDDTATASVGPSAAPSAKAAASGIAGHTACNAKPTATIVAIAKPIANDNDSFTDLSSSDLSISCASKYSSGAMNNTMNSSGLSVTSGKNGSCDASAPNAICTSGVETLGMKRLKKEDNTTAAMMHRINSNTANVPPSRVFSTFSSLPRGGYERVSPWADVRAASVGRAGRACRSDVRTSRAERSYGRRYTVAYAMGR